MNDTPLLDDREKVRHQLFDLERDRSILARHISKQGQTKSQEALTLREDEIWMDKLPAEEIRGEDQLSGAQRASICLFRSAVTETGPVAERKSKILTQL